jgi:hypothetical protein
MGHMRTHAPRQSKTYSDYGQFVCNSGPERSCSLDVIRPSPTRRESVVGEDVVMEKMTQHNQFAILFPLVVGVGAVVCTIFVHALAMVVTVNFFRYERKRGHAGARALIDLAILTLVISFAFVAHLIEIALMGNVTRPLWRISRVRDRLLLLGGQLHDTRLRGCASDPVLAVVGTVGGDEWSADVRCFGGDGLCCYTTVGSG